MREPSEERDPLTHLVIGAAMGVHREMGLTQGRDQAHGPLTPSCLLCVLCVSVVQIIYE